MISKSEEIRYHRQLILSRFGIEAQVRLKNAKVFVAGAGGLGGPLCFYLAAAGVGHLVIADRGRLELSNLNRQILHGMHNIDQLKADSANTTLKNLNPEIRIETHALSITDKNLPELAKDVDIVVDCLDNIETRHVLNRFCIASRIPLMHAGIDGWNAQMTLLSPPETPCIHCLFQDAKDTDEPKPVLGAVAGAMGTAQALETIKYLAGLETDLKNQLLYFDALHLDWVKISVQKDLYCPVCSKINY